GADVPAGEQQVLDVDRVQRAQRDVIVPVRVPALAAPFGRVDPAGWVQIDRPPAVPDAVDEVGLPEDVLLRQRVVADEPAVLPLAGYRSDPLQAQPFRLRILTRVLDVVPDA